MNSRIVIAGAAVVLTAAGAVAQERQPLTQHDKMTIEAKVQLAPARVPLEARIVKDAPYAAEFVIEQVQTLPDGNRIARRETGRVYRDSQGRMRREDDGESGQAVLMAITDPVAGTSYSLDPATRTAWKTPAEVAHAIVGALREHAQADPGEVERKRKVEAEIVRSHAEGGVVTHMERVPPPPPPPPPSGYKPSAAETKTEKLAPRTIEGLAVEGTRTTRTIPAGVIGNEQPIVSVTEQWRSPELQVLVMTRTADPRTGEFTYRLQNIVRGEQSRSWFEVPGDYTIKETGIRRLEPTVR